MADDYQLLDRKQTEAAPVSARPGGRLPRVLIRLDQFKYFPNPKVGGVDGVGSPIGGGVTVVLLVLMLYFAIDSYVEFHGRTNPIITQMIQNTEPSDMVAVEYAIATQVDNNMFRNPEYFSVTSEQADRVGDDVTRDFAHLEECYVDRLFPRALCAYDDHSNRVNANVQGGFIDDTFRYVRIRIQPCVNGTSQYDNGTTVTCKTPEEIDFILRNLVVNTLFLTGIEASLSWESNIFFTYNPGFLASANIFFELNSLTSFRNVRFGWEPSVLRTYSELSEVTGYNEPVIPEGPVMQFYLRISARRMNTEHHFDTLLDLLASWGGLWTTLVIMATPCLLFNTHKFWKHRTWDLGGIRLGKHEEVQVTLTHTQE